MKKTSILFLTIVLLSLAIVFTVKSEANEAYKSFSVGECTLVIPSDYSVGITKDGEINFLSPPSSDFHIFDIHWEKNINKYLQKEFLSEDSITVDVRTIGHLRIVKVIAKDKRESFLIIGDKFFIYSTELNDHTKALIDNCNETWSGGDFTFDKEEFSEQLQSDYDATKEEVKILINAIMKSMNKD